MSFYYYYPVTRSSKTFNLEEANRLADECEKDMTEDSFYNFVMHYNTVKASSINSQNAVEIIDYLLRSIEIFIDFHTSNRQTNFTNGLISFCSILSYVLPMNDSINMIDTIKNRFDRIIKKIITDNFFYQYESTGNKITSSISLLTEALSNYPIYEDKCFFDYFLNLATNGTDQKGLKALELLKLFVPYFEQSYSKNVYENLLISIDLPKPNIQIHTIFSVIALLNIDEENKENSINKYLDILENMLCSEKEIAEVVSYASEYLRFMHSTKTLHKLKLLTMAIINLGANNNEDAINFVNVSLKRLIDFNAITMDEYYKILREYPYIAIKCASNFQTLPYDILYNIVQEVGFITYTCAIFINSIKQSIPEENLYFFLEGFFQNATPSQFSDLSEWLTNSDTKCQELFSNQISEFINKTSIATSQFIHFACQICTNIDIDISKLSEIALDSIDAYKLPQFFIDNPSLIITDIEYLVEIVPPSPSLFKLIARFNMNYSKELKAKYPQFNDIRIESIVDELKDGIDIDTPLATITSLHDIIYDFDPEDFEALALMVFTKSKWSEEEKVKALNIILQLPLPYITPKLSDAIIALFSDSYETLFDELVNYSGYPVCFSPKLECSDAMKMVLMAGVYCAELAGSPNMKPALEWLLSGKPKITTPMDIRDVEEAINTLYRPEPTTIECIRIYTTGVSESYGFSRTHFLQIPSASTVTESLKIFFGNNEGTVQTGVEYVSRMAITKLPWVLVLYIENSENNMKVEESISVTNFMLNPQPANYRLVSYIGKDIKINSGSPTVIIYELEHIGFFEITEKLKSELRPADVLAGILIERVDWGNLKPNEDFALALATQYDIFSPLEKWAENTECIDNIIGSNIQDLLTLIYKNRKLFDKIINLVPDPEILFSVVDPNTNQNTLQELFKSIICTSIQGDGIILGIAEYPYSKAVQIAANAAIKKGVSQQCIETFCEICPEWRKILLLTCNDSIIPRLLPITKEDMDILKENNEKEFAITLLKVTKNKEIIQSEQSWLGNEREYAQLLKFCGKQPGVIKNLLMKGKYHEAKDLIFEWFPGNSMDEDILEEFDSQVSNLYSVAASYSAICKVFVKYFDNFKDSSMACNILLVYSSTVARYESPSYLEFLEAAFKINTILQKNVDIVMQAFFYSLSSKTAEVFLRALLRCPENIINYINYINAAYSKLDDESKTRFLDDIYTIANESNDFETQQTIEVLYALIYSDIDIERFNTHCLFEWSLFYDLPVVYSLSYYKGAESDKISDDISKTAKILRNQRDIVQNPNSEPYYIYQEYVRNMLNELIPQLNKASINLATNMAPYSQYILVTVLARLCIFIKDNKAPSKESADDVAKLVDTVIRFAFADKDIIDPNSTNDKLSKRIRPAVNLVFRTISFVSPSWSAVKEILQLATGILKHNDLAQNVKNDSVLTVLQFADYSEDVTVLINYLETAFTAIPGLWDSAAIRNFCHQISTSSNITEMLKIFKVLFLNCGDNAEDLNEGWEVVFDKADDGIPEIDELLSIIG